MIQDVELLNGPLDGLIVSVPSNQDILRFPQTQPHDSQSPEFIVYKDSGRIKRTSPISHLAIFLFHDRVTP